jgi:hypothetical protein
MKRDSVQLTGATIPMTLGLMLSKASQTQTSRPKGQQTHATASRVGLLAGWVRYPDGLLGSVSGRTAGFGIRTDCGVTPPTERTPQSAGGSDHEHGGT